MMQRSMSRDAESDRKKNWIRSKQLRATAEKAVAFGFHQRGRVCPDRFPLGTPKT
jgi:hypothetical protein